MSEPLEPGVPPDVLRNALRRAVEKAGLRPVARQAKLSPRGVWLIINEGVQSHPATIAKLRDWYVTHAPRVLGMSNEMAAALLVNLLGELDGVHREYAADTIEAGLRIAHQRQGLKLPGWVEALRNRPA